ncbi:lipase domain-containing protein [Phthorimaea operculella]|nr:lipase domain-containing protein [Phthorimaea operculella]
MKLLVIFATSIAFCAAYPHVGIPGDNSHYVEGESRFIWMPNGDGVPELVDLEDRTEVTNFMRNGANNQYFLFTRANPTNPQNLVHGDVQSVLSSNYDGSKPIKVIVHGWNSNLNSKVNTIITPAFLAASDCNVIVLDWRRAASAPNYFSSARIVPEIGAHLGQFLAWLIENAGGDWNRVHLVGHSLGAHVIGNAGRTVGGRIARITGLDPAGPIFGGNSNALNADDAQYVEAIHTDGGALGIMDPIGQTNFYPNGGRSQPGCLISTCSHSRVYELFAATVEFDHLVGQSCDSLRDARRERCRGNEYLNMGNDDLGKRGNGLFGLKTGRRHPF